MSKRAEIRVGDVVRLRKGTVPMRAGGDKTAIVVLLLADTPGGVRVDRHLGGARYWNVSDLAKTGRKTA